MTNELDAMEESVRQMQSADRKAAIYDPQFKTLTVQGVEFGIGFLTMLVFAAQEGETVTLELMSDGTILMTPVHGG